MAIRYARARNRLTSGMNIYAFKHIHTKQVVYSLTANMQESKIMPQLVFHGKKTVPAEIRPDMWRPYFAVHFPDDAAGRRVGLHAYLSLRKLSLQRQLNPPKGLLFTTAEDVELARKQAGDPTNLHRSLMQHKTTLPHIGQNLPLRMRQRKLMDHTATSVADLAYILNRSLEHLPRIAEKVETQAKTPLTLKQKKKLKKKVDYSKPKMDLLPGQTHAPTRPQNYIHVLWSDMRDGTYAAAWPEGVGHSELHPTMHRMRGELKESGYVTERMKGREMEELSAQVEELRVARERAERREEMVSMGMGLPVAEEAVRAVRDQAPREEKVGWGEWVGGLFGRGK
jgi:hypothetical protein